MRLRFCSVTVTITGLFFLLATQASQSSTNENMREELGKQYKKYDLDVSEGDENTKTEAKYQLGLCYKDGLGCEKDPYRGYVFFYLAHKKDVPEATYQLGLYHKEGEFAPLDPEEAFSYFKMAHEKGYLKGTEELADCYRKGFGCKQNKEEAERLSKLLESKKSNSNNATENHNN